MRCWSDWSGRPREMWCWCTPAATTLRGADLSIAQWQILTELLQRRRLTPFLDLAYQGFGTDLAADAAGVRLVTEALPEALIAVSHSKNLGLYRERVGALIVDQRE